MAGRHAGIKRYSALKETNQRQKCYKKPFFGGKGKFALFCSPPSFFGAEKGSLPPLESQCPVKEEEEEEEEEEGKSHSISRPNKKRYEKSFPPTLHRIIFLNSCLINGPSSFCAGRGKMGGGDGGRSRPFPFGAPTSPAHIQLFFFLWV